MTNPVSGKPEQGRDALREMSIERVERADGRYLIYYSWPDPEIADARGSSEEIGHPDV